MVTLPREFTGTKYPGYFWNIKTQTLFSIKVGGELRELRREEPNYFNRWHDHGYRISHKGRYRWMLLTYLEGLKLTDSEIPIRYRR